MSGSHPLRVLISNGKKTPPIQLLTCNLEWDDESDLSPVICHPVIICTNGVECHFSARPPLFSELKYCHIAASNDSSLQSDDSMESAVTVAASAVAN